MLYPVGSIKYGIDYHNPMYGIEVASKEVPVIKQIKNKSRYLED